MIAAIYSGSEADGVIEVTVVAVSITMPYSVICIISTLPVSAGQFQ